MAASRRKKVDLPRPELNITAMMDLVLNLITFFVLVANFAVASLPGLDPPNPEKSVAKVEENPNRVTVSVLAAEDLNKLDKSSDKPRTRGAGKIKVGTTDVAANDFPHMVRLLEVEVARRPNIEVYLRADKNIRYEEIEPFMLAIAGTGVQSFHMVAVASE